MTLPLLSDNFKEEIIEKISSKTLTEADISLTPNVSFTFWRECCQAFAIQCIGQEDFMRAIPYLLSCQEIDQILNILLEKNCHREAWIIAKMKKDEDDPIFKTIFQKWTEYCDFTGFYEGCAILHCCKKDYKSALEVLIKRKTQSEELKLVMEILCKKIAST